MNNSLFKLIVTKYFVILPYVEVKCMIENLSGQELSTLLQGICTTHEVL